jgi:hypothetical protein
VLEIAHVLTSGEATEEPDHGCHTVHSKAHGLALTSLAAGIPADVVDEEEAYKLILPPGRWPLGGRTKPSPENGTSKGGEGPGRGRFRFFQDDR